jgi:hypothetical protein
MAAKAGRKEEGGSVAVGKVRWRQYLLSHLSQQLTQIGPRPSAASFFVTVLTANSDTGDDSDNAPILFCFFSPYTDLIDSEQQLRHSNKLNNPSSLRPT